MARASSGIFTSSCCICRRQSRRARPRCLPCGLALRTRPAGGWKLGHAQGCRRTSPATPRTPHRGPARLLLPRVAFRFLGGTAVPVCLSPGLPGSRPRHRPAVHLLGAAGGGRPAPVAPPPLVAGTGVTEARSLLNASAAPGWRLQKGGGRHAASFLVFTFPDERLSSFKSDPFFKKCHE